VVKAAARRPRVEVVQHHLQVDFAGDAVGSQ
jgi:hypothetical protein